MILALSLLFKLCFVYSLLDFCYSFDSENKNSEKFEKKIFCRFEGSYFAGVGLTNSISFMIQTTLHVLQVFVFTMNFISSSTKKIHMHQANPPMILLYKNHKKVSLMIILWKRKNISLLS